MSDQTRDENKRNVETLFDDCFNQGDLGLIDQLVGPEYVGPQGDKGPAGFRAVVVGLRTGFPDIHYTLEDVIAEGDRVAVRWHWTGTHKGPFRAFPPTGKTFTNPGVGIFQFKDGKIVARRPGDRSPRLPGADGHRSPGRRPRAPPARRGSGPLTDTNPFSL